MKETGEPWAHSSANKSAWITLSVLTAALFCKNILYRHLTGMDALLSAGQLVAAYSSVMAVCLLFAMLAWIPRRWPAITLCILTDLWFIAGIWYYKANMLWINWQAISTLSELKGFAASISSYLTWEQLLLPLTTIAVIIVLLLIISPRTSLRACMSVAGMAAFLCVCAMIGRYIAPLDEETKQRSFHAEENHFIATHSSLMQMGKIAYDAVKEGLFHWTSTQPLTPREQEILAAICHEPVEAASPQGHLVYILVESWETWGLQAVDAHGQAVCPYLSAYIQTHPVLFVPGIRTQQKYGRSGDGQLITQTGLLPISTGVACRQFGHNTYPNLAHFYTDGIVFNPYRIPVWNQTTVTSSYGFQHLSKPRQLHNENDSVILQRTRDYLAQSQSPTAALVLTIDTHTPFRTHRDSIDLPDSLSMIEQNYLRSLRYTDRQIGRFLEWADTAATMQQATIVITADHNHFPVEHGHGLCPLIIASPAITHSVTVPEALQMDIFPTTLHAIGQSNYAWQGFGIDLLSENVDSLLVHRSIRPDEAYDLSDKLIQTNFFAQ